MTDQKRRTSLFISVITVDEYTIITEHFPVSPPTPSEVKKPGVSRFKLNPTKMQMRTFTVAAYTDCIF